MDVKRETFEGPVVYVDSPDTPEEHRKRVAEHLEEVDTSILQFRTHADLCYVAESVEALEETLEKLEYEVRKEFFFGLSSEIPSDLPETSILHELFRIDAEDPKKAAEWCGAIDPNFGTAYAMGWVRKQQMRSSLGLPNESAVAALKQLEAQEVKQLTAEASEEGTKSLFGRALGATKRWVKDLQDIVKKESNHG